MKIAIGYWGLIRGFKYDFVYESHIKNLIQPLRNSGHDVDIFVETYDKDFDDRIYELNPHSINILKDKEYEAMLSEKIDRYRLPDYFPEHSKMNLFKCLVSRKELSEKIDDTYDMCYLIDVGQEVLTEVDDPTTMDSGKIYIANQSHCDGYMNRLVGGCVNSIKKYGAWIDYLLEGEVKFSAGGTQTDGGMINLHPESGFKIYLNFIGEYPIEENNLLNCRVRRVRTNQQKEHEVFYDKGIDAFLDLPSVRSIYSSSYDPDFGRLLYEQVLERKPKIIYDIGVLGGYSTACLGYAAKQIGAKVVAVDLFEDYEYKNCSRNRFEENIKAAGLSDIIEIKKMSVEDWLELEEECYFVHLDISNDGDKLVNFFSKVKGKPFVLFEGGSPEREEVAQMVKYKKSRIIETLKEHGFSYKLLKASNYEDNGQKVCRSLSCIDLSV